VIESVQVEEIVVDDAESVVDTPAITPRSSGGFALNLFDALTPTRPQSLFGDNGDDGDTKSKKRFGLFDGTSGLDTGLPSTGGYDLLSSLRSREL